MIDFLRCSVKYNHCSQLNNANLFNINQFSKVWNFFILPFLNVPNILYPFFKVNNDYLDSEADCITYYHFIYC